MRPFTIFGITIFTENSLREYEQKLRDDGKSWYITEYPRVCWERDVYREEADAKAKKRGDARVFGKCVQCGSSDFLVPDPGMYMVPARNEHGETGYGCTRCSK